MILVADNLTITDMRVENAVAKIAKACTALKDDRIFTWGGFSVEISFNR